MKDREFDAVVQLAGESRVGRFVRWAVDSCRQAWAWSRIARAAASLWASVSEWPPDVRVRHTALTIAWAAAGYALSRSLLPRYVVSALPLPWIGTVVLFALIVAARPQAFVTAWREHVGARQKSMP